MTDPVAGWQWASSQGRQDENREAVRVWEPDVDQDPERIPAVAVLAGGVGQDGADAAEHAADAAHDCLGGTHWSRMAQRLARAGDLANDAIRKGKAQTRQTVGENGATSLLLVAMKHDGLLWWGAGNGVLFRLRRNGGLELVNKPEQSPFSPHTPGVALMGMPYYDPEKAGDGPDAPDGPLGLEPGDLVVVASAGIWMLPETTTETVLRNAVEAGGNPPRKC